MGTVYVICTQTLPVFVSFPLHIYFTFHKKRMAEVFLTTIQINNKTQKNSCIHKEYDKILPRMGLRKQ